MTTWAEMQPREREAWLAEKACGYVWMRQTGADGVVRRELLPPELANCVSLSRADMTERINMMRLDDYVPHYTTDPAAALQLAEAMRAKEYYVSIGLFPRDAITIHGYPFYCQIWRMETDKWRQWEAGSMDSLAAAIAHAAYRALGGE